MAFVSLVNLFVLLQLSLILCSSFAVYSFRTMGEYEPASSPQGHGPVSPPGKPPTHPKRAKQPSYAFPRRKVVIRGNVYCMYWYFGELSPSTRSDVLPGAVVKLQCNNTKHSWEEQTTSVEGGRFNFTPGAEKLTTFGVHKCTAFLVSSPDPRCPYIDYLLGVSSATLFPDPNPPPTNSTDNTDYFVVGRVFTLHASPLHP